MADEMISMSPMSDEPAQTPDPVEEYLKLKTMKGIFGRYGWALFVLTCVWVGILLIASIVVGVCEAKGLPGKEFYNKNMLLLNEIGLAIAVLAGYLMIRSVPKRESEKKSVAVSSFLKVLVICFAIGNVGNLIGNTFLTVWNTLTKNEVSNETMEIVMDTDPLMMILMVGLIGPFLEELFFRKLLIDRTRAYGELACTLTSAVLFGLFHQNFSQFFYAFGIGFVLAVFYYRTGNFFMTYLLHAVFNLISGVIASILSIPFLEFVTKLDSYQEEELLDVLPTLMGDYALPLMGYLLYLFVMGILALLGFIFFCKEIGTYKPMKGEISLPAKKSRAAIIKNAGILASATVFFLMMIMSLFTL